MITNPIVIKVNLAGKVNLSVRKEPVQIGVHKELNKDGKMVDVPTMHADYTTKEAYRRCHVAAEHVKFWQSLPGILSGFTPSLWKKMSPIQRLNAHMRTFDEGFGVSYEVI